MKTLLASLLTAGLFINAQAQSIAVNDSAQTGTSSSKMTFYSLHTGAKTVVDNVDWDLAISIRPSLYPATPLGGTTIRNNGANGVKVYYVPNARAAQFSNLDTAGWHSWTKQYDSDTSIDEGAFNFNRNHINPFDFGWGVYNSSTHNVTGDSLYLVELPNGAVKKFIVVNLAYDTAFNIKYANIDNSDSQYVHISKRDYAGKEFVYLSLTTNAVMDKEPMAADWDLQFLQYAATDVLSSQPVPQIGTWVNQSRGVTAAKRAAHSVNDDYYGNLTFSNRLNTIGWDWKYPGNTVAMLSGKDILANLQFYIIRDSLAYFIQAQDGNVYKLVFTRYNLVTGQINFSKTLLGSSTGIEVLEQNDNKLAVYPNPASTVLNVTTAASTGTLRVADITGRILTEETITGYNTAINTSQLSNGVYLLLISTEGKTLVRKFEVSK